MTKHRLPPLSRLIAFEAAARNKSIARAGKELNVSHSAVSRHIRNLEDQLGRDLFERQHRRIALTATGEDLLRSVATGLDHIEGALVQLSKNEKRERLVISVDLDFAGLWLVPRLAEFHALVPNTQVEILAAKDAAGPPNLQCDCAIHYAAAGLEFKNSDVLFRSRLFPVHAPDYVRALRSPEELRHHVLLHDRSTVEWQEYLRICSMPIDVNTGSATVFSETALCMEAASRGQGIAIGDDFLAAIHLSEGRLVRSLQSAFLSKNAYYLAVPEGGEQRPAVKAFRVWLLQTIERLRKQR